MDNILVYETKKYKYPACPIDFFEKKYSIDNMPYEPYSWHYHKEIEYLCVLKGSLCMAVESQTYRMSVGDWIVIEPGLAHHTIKNSDVEYVCVIFPVLSHIVDTFPEGSKLFLNANNLTERFIRKIENNFEIKSKGLALFQEMIDAQQNKKFGNLLLLRANIQKLMYYTIELLGEPETSGKNENYNYSKILPAIEYINENLAQKMDVNDLALLCHYNYFYFSKIFKYFMGTTVTEYINHQRYKYAKMYLLETNMSISEIAYQTGFPNENSLYIYFKKASGITPAQFRKENKK